MTRVHGWNFKLKLTCDRRGCSTVVHVPLNRRRRVVTTVDIPVQSDAAFEVPPVPEDGGQGLYGRHLPCPRTSRPSQGGPLTTRSLAHDLGYHPALSLSTGQVRVQEVESELPWRPLYFRDEIRRPYVDKDGPRSDARVSITVSENPRWYPVVHCQQAVSTQGESSMNGPHVVRAGVMMDDAHSDRTACTRQPPCRPCPAKMSLVPVHLSRGLPTLWVPVHPLPLGSWEACMPPMHPLHPMYTPFRMRLC